jgi:hypothetical protein
MRGKSFRTDKDSSGLRNNILRTVSDWFVMRNISFRTVNDSFRMRNVMPRGRNTRTTTGIAITARGFIARLREMN